MNFLFICSRNQWRSPTAERTFAVGYGINTRSAGTSKHAKHSLSAQDLAWADTIFVMEEKHQRWIREKFSRQLGKRKIIVLDIPDEYQYMDPELVEILLQSMQPYLEQCC